MLLKDFLKRSLDFRLAVKTRALSIHHVDQDGIVGIVVDHALEISVSKMDKVVASDGIGKNGIVRVNGASVFGATVHQFNGIESYVVAIHRLSFGLRRRGGKA